ncbi:hypothetical protein [Petropleomorpha daqingensis]|uniref:Uncharacterized protein n=1 Tax=Petropleomorpha daqingensis TaxID=2026353 RepID=A0A853CMZ7_9ACTN|nr:hypothetical protein [Petropleomorpha daqingensis]NYJ08927.1 hypothetical protein [Petropleomorpha daqingensis]
MTVSLLDVLVSGRPDRPALSLPRGYTTGALFVAAVVVSGLAGRRIGQSEVTPRTR